MSEREMLYDTEKPTGHPTLTDVFGYAVGFLIAGVSTAIMLKRRYF